MNAADVSVAGVNIEKNFLPVFGVMMGQNFELGCKKGGCLLIETVCHCVC